MRGGVFTCAALRPPKSLRTPTLVLSMLEGPWLQGDHASQAVAGHKEPSRESPRAPLGRKGSWSWAGTYTHLTGEVDLVGGGFIFLRREHRCLVKRSSLHERAGLVCDCQERHKVQLLGSDHGGRPRSLL